MSEASQKQITAEGILRSAAYLIGGDRNAQHGDRSVCLSNIATLWNAYLEVRRDPGSKLAGRDVAIMMSLLKIARMESGSVNPDNAIDGAGYLALAGELS